LGDEVDKGDQVEEYYELAVDQKEENNGSSSSSSDDDHESTADSAYRPTPELESDDDDDLPHTRQRKKEGKMTPGILVEGKNTQPTSKNLWWKRVMPLWTMSLNIK